MADTGYIVDQLSYVEDGYIGLTGSPVAFLYDVTTGLYFARAPQRPAQTLGFVQPLQATTGAERIVEDYLVKNAVIELHWANMLRFDRDRLLFWWLYTARGMVNAFTYVDLSGSTALVRFSDSKLPEIRERAYDSFEVTIRLRVQ